MRKYIIIPVLVLMLSLLSYNAFSQGVVPPPPPEGAGHGASGNQNGGNAPIGGGLFILLGLGAAYGGRKLYRLKSQQD